MTFLRKLGFVKAAFSGRTLFSLWDKGLGITGVVQVHRPRS
jgi:hypothetical protein